MPFIFADFLHICYTTTYLTSQLKELNPFNIYNTITGRIKIKIQIKKESKDT